MLRWRGRGTLSLIMSILICYDDSSSARRALEVTSRTVSGRPVILLHVYTAPEAVLADAFSTRGSDPSTGLTAQDRLETLAAVRAGEIIEAGRALAAELDLEVEARTWERRPDRPVWRTILDAAGELDAEVIVAGTRGPTTVGDDVLGSVSRGLARHSNRPLLLVPLG